MPEISSGDVLALAVAYVGGTAAILTVSYYFVMFLVGSLKSFFKQRRHIRKS